MSANFVLLVQPSAEERGRLQRLLADAGFRVMAVGSDGEALEQLERLNFFPPDLLLTPLDASPDGSETLARLRSSALSESLPVVALGNGEAEDRRRALRHGFHHVPPPYDGEELLLTVRLAIEQHRDEHLLKGTLAQLSVPDLLQTLESTRRSGTMALRDRGRNATLWLREGQVIDAEADGGLKGQEAVFAIADWSEGTFEADFKPISVPQRISVSTSYLLLEAMRRLDESRRREESPPSAALPDPPPAPPRAMLAVHRSLTLLTVASSYAVEHLQRPLLARRLEERRRELLAEHPSLAAFTVDDAGVVAMADGFGESGELGEIDVDDLVTAVAAWLRAFFEQAEKSLPGRFSISKLRALTEAIQEDLSSLGFYRALGLSTEEES